MDLKDRLLKEIDYVCDEKLVPSLKLALATRLTGMLEYHYYLIDKENECKKTDKYE